jgi:hypothetical protein
LPNYRSGNGSHEAGSGEAARSALEDGEGGLWCSFGSGDGSGGGGDDGWPFSMHQLDTGGLNTVGRWCELGRLWRLGFR